jgi:hypothetical protein
MRIGWRGFEFDDHSFERLNGEVLLGVPEAIEVGNLSRLLRNFSRRLARGGEALMRGSQEDDQRLGLFVERHAFVWAESKAQDSNPAILDFKVVIVRRDMNWVLRGCLCGKKYREQTQP